MSPNDTPEQQIPPDPIYAKSLSRHILLATLAVLAAVGFAIVDELWLRRPYKPIQVEYRKTYTKYLEGLQARREATVEEVLKNLDEYRELEAEVGRVKDATAQERAEISAAVADMDAELRSLNEALKSPKSEIAAQSYLAEHAASEAGYSPVSEADGARPYLDAIERIEQREVTYEWTLADGSPEEATGRVGELIARIIELQDRKAARQSDLAKAGKPLSEATKNRNKWLKDHLGDIKSVLEEADDDVREAVGKKVMEVGAKAYIDNHVTALDAGQVAGLIRTVEEKYPSSHLSAAILGGKIEQIHIPQSNNWVDRCETCHLATREPLPLRAEDMGGNRLFVSHPRKELLATHDPERFGCSTCHNGNGVAITGVETAHGENKHWLHPLHPPENFEAGCVQCHERDLVLPMGERITAGRENIRHYGCYGCHKMRGYDPEPELIRETRKRISDIDDAIAAKARTSDNLQATLDTVFDVDEERFNDLEPETRRQRDALAQEMATLETERGALDAELRDLLMEKKKVGPNLKEIRAKLKPQWLTQWLADPKGWRPDTKMPKFPWANDEEVKDVAAFLWQSAVDVSGKEREYGFESYAPGDPTQGRDVVYNYGCLACHAIGEGDAKMGKGWAANLSNLGEKSNYEYVVRWLKDPRHRLAPYCPECKRDLGPEDYRKHGKEFVFDFEHSKCPDCGSQLQRSNPVRMPSLRLSDEEARDAATFLVSQKRPDVTFETPTWLGEKERFDRGHRLAQHYGCAGCHEIAGLEDEGGIGTELSVWGSKPHERLDFGHYTTDAKRGNDPMQDWVAPKDGEEIFADGGKWYDHRGFAMRKLAKPDLYDTSKNLDRWAKQRMPYFGLGGQEIHDVVSYLLGSVEDQLPESTKYRPGDRGQAIQEGWWVVRRYNCEGCHQINPGEVPAIQELPHFLPGQEHEGDAPPSLVGTGFRTQPDWLARFLHDPSLGGGTEHPKSGRPYLSTRMPTFHLTQNEIAKLVRFFDAMSKQPTVYQRPQFPELSPAELRVAATTFKDAKCAQCHVVDGQPFTSETKAPNLNLAQSRLRPEWVARWLKNPSLMVPGTAMPALYRQDASGRWYYQNEGLPEVKAYEGDHVELMVRYLISLSGE